MFLTDSFVNAVELQCKTQSAKNSFIQRLLCIYIVHEMGLKQQYDLTSS